MKCITWLLFIGGVLFTSGLWAQEQNSWTDIEYIRNSNPWLSSENAAGLDRLSTKKISFIEAFYNKKNGDFINFYQSDNSYSFGGMTESYYRLNKLVFYGKMKYSNFSGNNMGGSTLLDPYFSSFDIVEFADSTAGKKNMETYHLIGAFSLPVYKKLLLGVKADYKTASYYKIKDLRHTNDLMNMETTVGLSYLLGEFADIGSNYYFRKRVENTLYQAEGNTDQQFNSLISYGSFMGKQEKFGMDGFTGDDDNNPFVDYIHGVSFQIDILPKNKLHFFNEVGLKWRSGYFGQKSSVNIQYTEHEANSYHYQGVLVLKRLQNLHQLSVNFEREDLLNFENSYKESTTEGGNTTVVYYGKNEVLDRVLSKASFQYTGNINVIDNNPEWVINTDVSLWRRDQVATFYPYYRKQDVKQVTAGASVKRNILHNRNMYSISLGGNYGSGSGTVKDDGSYASASENYATLDHYLYREYEYLTTGRASGNVEFRYTKAFPGNYRIYAEMQYSYTKAFDLTYVGDTCGKLALSIGYIF
ncbi:DUF6850 family outer membrane beta-barrel protein [uncultured Draconibacterium sp.]|uniref:DUF6850 family outer membrane beta-barrel protein n=1 Tax=uncultured Draconibacterium sp. TaxID=1573823 RepID=UPI0025F05BAF|nr:DUF6850 family outer membrane beta-barrel protein [uncultured Draconibacterium sp.]